MALPVIPDTPFVFLSYSWKDKAHVQWVQGEVYNYLKQALEPAIHVVLDVNEDDMLNLQLNHGSIAGWMLDACKRAAVVIVVCSPGYKASTEITEGRSAVYLEYQRGILPRLLEPMSYVTLVYDQACGLEIPSITPDDLGRAFFALPFQSDREKIARFVREAVRIRALPAGSRRTIAAPGARPNAPGAVRPSTPHLELYDTARVTSTALEYASKRAEWCPQRLSYVPVKAQVRVAVEEIETGRWPWSSKEAKVVPKEYIVEDAVSAVESAPRPRIILLGDPAAGKSTAMRKLARELLEPWIDAGDAVDEAAPGNTPFPIFIDLGGLSPSASLVDYIKDCAVPAGLGAHQLNVADTLAQLLDPQVPLPANFPRVVVLLDSFDEAAAVRHHDAQGQLMDEISEFCNALENKVGRDRWMVMVAMRKHFEPADPNRQWARFTLIDLDTTRQRQKIVANLGPEHHRDALLTELATNADLQQPAGNPLMLDLIMQYWRTLRDLPQPGHLQIHDVLGQYWRSQSTGSHCYHKDGRECVLGGNDHQLHRLADAIAYVLACTEEWSVRRVFERLQPLAERLTGVASGLTTDFATYVHALEHLHAMSVVTVGPMWSIDTHTRGTLASAAHATGQDVPIRFVHRRILEYFAASFFLRHMEALGKLTDQLGMSLPLMHRQSREVLIPAMQVKPLYELEPVVAPFVAILEQVDGAVVASFTLGQERDGLGEAEVYHVLDIVSGGFRGRRQYAEVEGGPVIARMLDEYDRVVRLVLRRSRQAVLLQRRYLRFATFLSRKLPLTSTDDARAPNVPSNQSPGIAILLRFLGHPVYQLRFEAFDILGSLGRLSKSESEAFEAVVPAVLGQLSDHGRLYPERDNIKLRLRSVIGTRDLTPWVNYLSRERLYSVLPRIVFVLLVWSFAVELHAYLSKRTWVLTNLSLSDNPVWIPMTDNKLLSTIVMALIFGLLTYSVLILQSFPGESVLCGAVTTVWWYYLSSLSSSGESEPWLASTSPLLSSILIKLEAVYGRPFDFDLRLLYPLLPLLEYGDSSICRRFRGRGAEREMLYYGLGSALGLAFTIRFHLFVVYFDQCRVALRSASWTTILKCIRTIPQGIYKILCTTGKALWTGFLHYMLRPYILLYTTAFICCLVVSILYLGEICVWVIKHLVYPLLPPAWVNVLAACTILVALYDRSTSSLVRLCNRFEEEEAGQGISMEIVREIHFPRLHFLTVILTDTDIPISIGNWVQDHIPRSRRHRGCQNRLANGEAKLRSDIDPAELRLWYENAITPEQQERMMGVVEAFLTAKAKLRSQTARLSVVQ